MGLIYFGLLNSRYLSFSRFVKALAAFQFLEWWLLEVGSGR